MFVANGRRLVVTGHVHNLRYEVRDEGLTQLIVFVANGRRLVVTGHVHNLRYEVRDEGLTQLIVFVAMVDILLFEIMFTISREASYLGCKKGVQRFGCGG